MDTSSRSTKFHIGLFWPILKTGHFASTVAKGDAYDSLSSGGDASKDWTSETRPREKFQVGSSMHLWQASTGWDWKVSVQRTLPAAPEGPIFAWEPFCAVAHSTAALWCAGRRCFAGGGAEEQISTCPAAATMNAACAFMNWSVCPAIGAAL